MQNYKYTARDDFGKVARGTMFADDEQDLANKISNLGYYLVRAEVIAATSKISSKSFRLKPRDILNTTIHLSTLLGAGVPLIRGLIDLARDAEKESIQRVLNDLRYRVDSGSSLKEALAFHPGSFPKLYVAIVGAGEATGKLSACLEDLANFLEWQMELKAKVKEAATYPIILFCAMLAVVFLLVIKVIPVFEPIFKEAGAALPLPTQIVLGVSHFLRNFWYIILGFFILLMAGYRTYNSTSRGKYRLDSLKLKLPLCGSLLRKVAIARFSHTFSLALKSGVPVLTALDIAGEVIGNSRLEQVVLKGREAVNRGEKIAESFQLSKEFPPLVVRMIGVGEQSGALVETMGKVNQFYDREVLAAVKKIFVLFEPIMIVVMGVVVGGIALSIFLPMFQLAQIVGG